MAVSNTSPNTDNYFVGKGNVYFLRTGATAWRHVGNVPQFEITLAVDKLDHFSSMEGTRKKDRSIVREQTGTVRMVMEELTADNIAMALMADPDDAALTPISTTVTTASGSTALTALGSVTGLVEGRRYNIAFTGSGPPADDQTFVFDGTSGGTLDTPADATAVGTGVTITGGVGMDIFSLSEITGKIRFVGSNDVGAKVTYDLNNVSITPSSSFNPISEEWGNFEVTGEILVDSFGKFGQAYWNIQNAPV